LPRPDDAERILSGLNPEQRRAVEAVRGPVCILAGAGSGKTTTITHRIAYQVASGIFAAGEILAVTFTDKAAAEMRERLRALGVTGVRARTFHATALAQLHHLVPETGAILPSKAPLLAPIVQSLHRAYRFRPLAEFATEIEWAKNRRLGTAAYLDGLGHHEPPLPADLMLRVFQRYESRKRAEGRIDFEDVLELLVRHYESHPGDAERFRARCRAITVDEYQDVNLLQQTLLDLWLGERDELCAVGDDYQSIYSFTGATSTYLRTLPERFPGTRVVLLEENHRSTPEILELANRLVPGLGGAEKRLRATREGGPRPSLEGFASQADEARALVQRIRLLIEAGVPAEEVAILYRVNARSEDVEAPLAAAGIPYQVRGGGFLERPAARAVLRLLRRTGAEPAAAAMRETAGQAGLLDEPPEALGEEGLTYQGDLRRLVALAAEFDDGSRTVDEFLEDLRARFHSEGDGRGVQLLTYHRAKGLEFEAVFLPFLQAGELPIRQAKSAEAVDEERRLLYVGITRARTHLLLSWSHERKPSAFLRELGAADASPAPVKAITPDGPVFAALKAWRLERARADGVPAYVVFDNKTLAAIAQAQPGSHGRLAEIAGVGPVKLERYADDVLAVLANQAGRTIEPSAESVQ
jgi:ATP-dependent DNA helicase UvrD/PcrA